MGAKIDRLSPEKSGRIGVIGLGVMGRSLARRLIGLDYEVWGHDVSPSAEREAESFGVHLHEPARVASLNVVLTSLPDDAAVAAALIGSKGIMKYMAPGSLLIELSTILPGTMRQVAAVGREHEVAVIDCAISGGPEGAVAGSIGLIVGAADADFARALPLLKGLGTVDYAGEVGHGKIVKLVNNVMTMGNVLIAAEAFTMGVKAGIPPQKLFDIISHSGGTSHHFVKRFPNLLKRDFAPRFSLKLGEKDVRLALAFAEEVNASLPVTAIIHQLYRAASALDTEAEDIVAVAKLYERLDGVVA